jgi:hypothetical protein
MKPPMNGVPLHPRIHMDDVHFDTEDYVDRIEGRLFDAANSGGTAKLKAELEKIGEELFDGTFDFDS